MNAVLAFAIVMAVWTVSDWVAKKTQSLLSSLFVASIIFFIGFLTDIFPDDLLASSSLLGLGGVVVGFIIVHLGTLISIDEFKRQWKTLVVGISTVVGIGVLLYLAGFIFGGGRRQGAYDGVSQAMDYVVAGIGSLSGGTISVLIIQEAALAVPLLIAFVFGIAGIALFAGVAGKLLGYTIPMSIAIGLTSLYGFPGTMILSQEAAKGAGETPEEVAAIEGAILPKMIIAGFSTVTITSVIVTGLIASRIGS